MTVAHRTIQPQVGFAGMFVYDRDLRGHERPFSIGAGTPEDMGSMAKLHEKRNEEALRRGLTTAPPRRIEIVYGFETQADALRAMQDRFWAETAVYNAACNGAHKRKKGN